MFRFVLCGVIFLQLSSQAFGMDCNAGGISIACPTILDDKNDIFCCQSSLDSRIEVCCDAGDFLRQNTAILAGILVGALLLIIICTVCCCCFCSCCWLARRRTHRGQVLYGPLHNSAPTVVTFNVPPPSYRVTHAPPQSEFSAPPPPYQPTTTPQFKY